MSNTVLRNTLWLSLLGTRKSIIFVDLKSPHRKEKQSILRLEFVSTQPTVEFGMNAFEQKVMKDFFKQFPTLIVNALEENYWSVMRSKADDAVFLATTPAFFFGPKEITIYLGYSHVCIEYTENDAAAATPEEARSRKKPLKVKVVKLFGEGRPILDEIVGIDFSGHKRLHLSADVNNFVLPTKAGSELLNSIGWREMPNAHVVLDVAGMAVQPMESARLMNCDFFDAENGGLISRHIKCLDVIPFEFGELCVKTKGMKILMNINQLLRKNSAYHEPLLLDVRYGTALNKFKELLAKKTTRETDITKFLAEPKNSFMIKMACAAKNFLAEAACHWQNSGAQKRKNIKPDFFIKTGHDYFDILEFKLPRIKHKTTVGAENRTSFSSEINNHIAQTRVYEEYFEDKNNREWAKLTHGLYVLKPKRTLVVGRKSDFSSEDWKRIEADYANIKIQTYDDFIETIEATLASHADERVCLTYKKLTTISEID